MTPLSLGNIILLKENRGMRESIPRQVDEKPGVPEEQKGVWGSQGGEVEIGSGVLKKEKRTNFFFFFSL